jgi:hypothetical protein
MKKKRINFNKWKGYWSEKRSEIKKLFIINNFEYNITIEHFQYDTRLRIHVDCTYINSDHIVYSINNFKNLMVHIDSNIVNVINQINREVNERPEAD